jgi:Sulfotransferase family
MITETPTLDYDRSLDQPYLERLKDIQVRPVFIIAPHRSGTTLLYRTLAESGSFNIVTVNHIINRHRLLHLYFTGQFDSARAELNRYFESKGVPSESQNSRQFNADNLEEYCYAFDRQPHAPRLSPENAESFQVFCRKLQVIQSPAHRLLLKNPFDGIGFLYIPQVFPEARFVFIYRNPVHVISSRVRLNRVMLGKKFEYHATFLEEYARLFANPVKLALARMVFSPKLPIMTELVLRDVSRHCDYVRENFSKLGERAIGVTYPELCNEPTRTVHRIMDFLGIPETNPRDYSFMIRKREPDILPEVERRRQRILKRNAAYCREFHV